jgi:hypothetical protein
MNQNTMIRAVLVLFITSVNAMATVYGMGDPPPLTKPTTSSRMEILAWIAIAVGTVGLVVSLSKLMRKQQR